jgi:hypothetical protein
MCKKENAVMPTLKGSMVNVIPTMDNVDYDRIYHFTPEFVDRIVEPLDCKEEDKDKYIFHYFKGNRDVKKFHVTEIKNGILKGKHKGKYYDNIRVDIPTMKIIDGQHRINGLREAWLEGATDDLRVRFECLPKDEREAMEIIADIQKVSRWNIEAYTKRLRQEGNESIINIDEFANTHSLVQRFKKNGEMSNYTFRYVTAILLGRNATKEVQNGTITVTEKDKMFGEKIYSELEKIVDVLNYPMAPWFESFVHAWYGIRNKDKVYNEIIDRVGIDNIAKSISECFDGFHPVSRKTTWEEKFRDAIAEANKKYSSNV